MADIQSNIHVNIDTSDALASLKLLQRQISAFHTQMAKSGTAASAVAANQAQNLMNSINATGQFQASMRQVTTSTEHFTNALERNKLTSREYFRYTGAATKTFGRLFKSEFETINKVARERVKDVQTQYIKMGRGANGALQSIAVRPLTLDMKNLGTQTAIAAQRQQLLNQLLKQGSTNLLNFGKNTQWAGRQLMVGFTVPLAMLGTTAAKTFMKLEEQAIRFKRVYGEMFTTQEETDAMVKQIQTLAREYTKYGVAVEDTMKMAADAAAMGKMGAELTAQVAQATRLAVLGGVEQAQALETTISVTNAFGVAAEDLANKIDFLNAVENQTVVSIEDLTIAIPKAGPVVQQLGGDVEDLAFFLTAMKEGGINASEGANALKSGLASLINPSEKASKMLAGLGVNIRGIVEANKGDIKGTVVGFAQALDTLDPLNRARAIEQLFGKFQFSRLSTLFQNVTAQGTQAQRVLGLTKATTEELAILSQREMDKIQNTTTYKFKKSMEDLKVAIAPVGEQFLKALTPIVEFVGKILDKFNNLGDGTKKFITLLTVGVAGVGPVLLMTFGLIANAAANIIKLFAGIKSMYNRTGNTSRVLGEQTNYLSKEQIEASAVAASLDQVHQRLRQTFTSEASAVNALATAYRNAIAAQIGFTGPVRTPGKMAMPPQSRKYSTGITSVPGTGNGDTIPAMLTPGEAVIPAGPAQDPANRPIIARMVAGQKVQGFNGGSTGVTYNGKEYNAKTAQGARSVREFLNQLVENPDKTLTDPKTGKTFTKARLAEVIDYRSQPGKTLTASQIRRSIQRENMSNRSPLVKKLVEVYNEKNASLILEEKEAVQKALKDRGLPPLTETQAKDSFTTSKAHREKDIGPDGKKRWRVVNISPDPGYINNYMNTIEGDLGKNLLNMTDAELEKRGIDRKELKSLMQGKHPTTAEAARTFRNIARHDIELDKTRKVKKANLYQAHLVDAGLEWRAAKGVGAFGEGGLKSLADIFPKDKGVIVERVAEADPSKRFGTSEQRLLKETADLASKTKSGQLPPTNFGKLVAPTTGYSFDVPGVGGLYDGPNGKVFVKPMMSELDALAEKRATDFARQVHGLDTPEQKISTMIDPSDPEGKRKIIVLESKYDSRFDEKKMPKTFTRDQYFRQLVAAGLRGDKDLKMGNLGGNVLTDVGTAGVFDRATSTRKAGLRTVSTNMPSIYEMAERNLQGVPGSQAKNSPNWFANETQKKINSKSYTAEHYDRDMKKEIKRIQANTEAFVSKIPLDDPLRPAYLDILRRVNEGAQVRDWKPLYDKHRSIAIKPNEVVVDEKGKAKKPKTQPKGKNTKTKNPSDTRTVPKGKAGAVRNVTNVRGRADAPTIINPALAARIEERAIEKLAKKKALAEANARQRYGTDKPTAYEKALRRKNDSNAKQGLPLVGVPKAPVAPVDYVTPEVRERAAALRAAREANAAEARQANARKMYGTEAPTASQKSIRKQNDKLQRQGKPLIGLTKELAAPVSVFSKVLDKATQTVQKNTVSAKVLESFKARQAKQAAAKAAGTAKPGMGMGGALGLASGAAMIGSMAPGKVGEISQKLMMPLMGLSMIAPMLKSPVASVALGLTAIVGSIIALRMAFDKAANKVLEEGEKFKGSNSAINNIAKFSGKVTASEQMDLRRKNSFQMLGPATGKTTYGEAFVQTKEGKELTKRVSQQNAAGKGNVAAKDLSGQLSAAIMSGAMDMNQARSLAMNTAREAGDMSIGLKVIAQMEEMLGPNGERLDKEPLKVRMDMVAANAKNMQNSAKNINKANPITKLAGQATMQKVGIGATAAAGATVGAVLGSIVPGVGNVVGAIIGGGIGAAAGAIGGYFASKKFTEQAGQLGAAYAVDAKIALEQNKQMLDSLDMYYQKKIEELRLQGKINEALELEKKYLGDKEKGTVGERDKLTNAQAKLSEDMISQYNNAGGLQESMMNGMKKSTTARYKNDPNQLAYVDVVNTQAANLQKEGLIDSGQEFLIQAKMASGDIPPAVFRSLLQLATDNEDIAPKMMNIITKFSGATSESIGVAAQNILGADKVVNKTVQTEFINKVSAFEKESDALDFTKNMIKLNNLNAVIPSDVMVSYYTKNTKAYEDLNKMLDSIEGEKDLTAEIVYKIIPKVEGTAAFDEAYFNTLDENEQKVYSTTIASLINVPEPEILESADFKAWRQEGGPKGGKDVKGSKSYIVQKYIESQGWKAVKDGVQVDTSTAPPGSGGGGATKVEASPLDDLVKKLRDVRKNQIKVTEGWSASRKALDGLFGGKKTIDVFSGIENDIRKLGGSQDFIELIVGMDPKEYEKRKNSLFKFDNKGNIVGLKNDAKNIQEAMNSIAMGDWNSSMEAESKALLDQGKAFDRIAGLGVPVANAYDLITDKTIAQAIANGVNDKTLKTLISRYKGLTEAQEKSAAIQGVRTDIAQFKKDRVQEDRIRSKYSSETAAAIGSDENLRSMESAIAAQEALVQKRIKSGADKELIKTAQADLNKMVSEFDERLNQLKNTIGYMQDIFDEGFGNAMEAFDVQETALQIKFDLDTKESNKIIEEAQNTIAGIQYSIDDKEASLKAIEDQEKKINEKYDERIRALDEVEKANASIADQQRGQLTLAEALTSGDIAAAARAAQDMRAQQAADAVTKQKDAVDQARQYELDSVKAYDPTTKSYKTRKELEADIKKLQDEIFDLEEKKIEPAQEFVRLRQIQLDKDIEGLTVLGKTRDAWEAIKNQVDVAMISSKKFIESMQLGLNTQNKLIQGYNNQQASGNDPIVGAAYDPGVVPPPVVPAPAVPAPAVPAPAVPAPEVPAPASSSVDGRAALSKLTSGQTLSAAERAYLGMAPVVAPKTAAEIVAERKAKYGYLSGGGIVPKYFAAGGFARGTDTIPAMLTPGEFVMSKYAVDSYGIDNLKKINNGDASGGAVYNNTYTLTVNAKTDANPNEIAQAVMSTIKQVEDRRIRGIGINGR